MKVKEQVMRWVFAATAALSIAAVALICVFLFLNGLPFFTKYDLGAFLSGTTWKPANNIFGILPMIVGSLYVTGGALLFGHWRWARQMNAVCSARLSRQRNPAFWRRLCWRLAAPSARQWRSRWSSAISRA